MPKKGIILGGNIKIVDDGTTVSLRSGNDEILTIKKNNRRFENSIILSEAKIEHILVPKFGSKMIAGQAILADDGFGSIKATVETTAVDSNSIIILTPVEIIERQLTINNIIHGVSFDIVSISADDIGKKVNWLLINRDSF